MTESDTRINQLRQWLQQADLPVRGDPATLRPASSDASFRRYFRLDRADGQPGTLIAMDAPPPQEDCAPFVHAAEVLQQAGVTVPSIFAVDLAQGFLLLSDLGSETMLQRIESRPDQADALYRQACAQLVTLQQASTAGTFAAYDRAMQLRELRLFDKWYLQTHLKAELPAPALKSLLALYETILDNTTNQPQVYVHRDWHSRNLMALPADSAASSSLAVIDFQDAVYGPVTYDLVSLLRDAYIDWPEDQQIDWAVRYWEVARRTNVPVHADFGDFYRDLEWMGMQRHLKVLGIFARLAWRDGKQQYLGDMPRVKAYVMATARRYREFAPLVQLLQRLDGVAEQSALTF